MLNNIRKFAKTKFAGILIGIIIIPFVFWGMGGTFSSGNKNNLVKINNKSISTKDFFDQLQSSRIDLDKIKKNLDNDIIEQIIAELISKKMISMEIEDLGIVISDKILNKKIKENKNFKDENNKFSRTKYEKFLLSAGISAPSFEYNLKKEIQRENLFNYISGGLKPPLFLVNNNFKSDTKKIKLNYLNLTNLYKNKDDFTNDEISKFIEENKNTLEEKLINFQYSKITPKNLTGLEEFNNIFFEKIDELENEISKGVSIENLQKKYNLEINIIEKFTLDENKNEFYKTIYNNSESKKIGLIEENDFYVLYQVTNVEKKLPSLSDQKFISKVKEMLFNKSKFEYNNDLNKKILKKSFTNLDYEKLANNNSSEIEINSINDNKKFSLESIKFIYSKTINDFALIADNKRNIYLTKILNISYKEVSKNSENFTIYNKQTIEKIKKQIYGSYDFFINDKYNVKINEKTLDRVKNHFR